jgi:hypothetical protein
VTVRDVRDLDSCRKSLDIGADSLFFSSHSDFKGTTRSLKAGGRPRRRPPATAPPNELKIQGKKSIRRARDLTSVG